MGKIGKILKFEYLNYIKGKTFIIMTAILLGLLLILGNLPHIVPLFSDSEPEETTPNYRILGGIIDKNNEYSDETLKMYFPNYVWKHLSEMSDDEIKESVGTSYAVVIEIEGTSYRVFEESSSGMYMGVSQIEALTADMVLKVNQMKQMEAYNLTSAQAQEIVGTLVSGESITVGKDASQNYFLGYIMLFILYMATILYGQFVTVSVVSEKTSKAVELLITSVRPTSIMFGKVLGAGLAGLTQLGLISVTAGVMLAINQKAWLSFSPVIGSIMNISFVSSYLIFMLISFLLGFFIFAFLYAAMGSTVSRMEEANSVVTIPMILFVAAFFIAISALGAPETNMAKVCSFIPFLSPMVMFSRVVASEVPLYQICISVVINLASIFFMGVFSSRVYKTFAMMYGQKPSLGKIFKHMITNK